jgi:hypothetical protein
VTKLLQFRDINDALAGYRHEGFFCFRQYAGKNPATATDFVGE